MAPICVWLHRPPVRYAVVASRGVWRSLVARFVRDEEVVGSNPATPTAFTQVRGPWLAATAGAFWFSVRSRFANLFERTLPRIVQRAATCSGSPGTGVGVQRQYRGRVAEHHLNRPRIRAGADRQRGHRVPEIVRRHDREPPAPTRRVDAPPPPTRAPPCRHAQPPCRHAQHTAGRRGEHQILATLPTYQRGELAERNPGTGTERRSCDFGVDQTTRPPSSATAWWTSTCWRSQRAAGQHRTGVDPPAALDRSAKLYRP